MKKIGVTVFFLLLGLMSFAQENLTGQKHIYLDSINLNRQQLDLIQNLKFTGYFQFQYQFADTAGIHSYSGGDFNSDASNRFMIRRGRLKMVYSDKISSYVLQFDATEKGVAIRDAYLKFAEQKFKLFELTAGVFDRQIGYEISYSSRLRETPERGRMSQILFPNERDLGAALTLNKAWDEKKQFVKWDAGLFNGTGFMISDVDSKKDFISRINYENNSGKRFKYGVGASVYSGSLINASEKVYEMKGQSFVLDSSANNVKKYEIRRYFGVNAQLSCLTRLGTTIIRAEYINGIQPGTPNSSSSPVAKLFPGMPTYMRHFDGAYFYLIQNILQTKHQLVVKYDWYDPNKNVKGKEVGLVGSGTNATDVRFNTLGLGYNYNATEHVKFMLYYEIVNNEITSIQGINSTNDFTKDLKDNVATIRMQYKF